MPRGRERPTCSIEGCNGPHAARGFCSRHYQRWCKHGDPMGGKSHRTKGEALRWLQDAVQQRDRSECWPWPFTRNGADYGEVCLDGKNLGAHVAALILDGRPKPHRYLDACHSCLTPDGRSNASCCNPAHLRWDTRSANMQDALAAGWRPAGQPGGRNPSALLTEEDVVQILALRDHLPSADIGLQFGVTARTVRAILFGESWHHVPRPPRLKGQRKLTLEAITEIRRAVATGESTQRALAKRFGVSPACICNAAKGKTHASVAS